jgi:hypothetical protein
VNKAEAWCNIDENLKRDLFEFKGFFKFDNETTGTKHLKSSPTLRVVSAGPNNKPKWQTAELEAYALTHSDYATHFKILCEATNNYDLYKYIEAQSMKLHRGDKVRLRYILSIPDKGNKSRIVAISDYWTQTLLRPIMVDVKSWIEEHFGDVVYSNDHSKGFENLLKVIRPDMKSIDIVD